MILWLQKEDFEPEKDSNSIIWGACLNEYSFVSIDSVEALGLIKKTKIIIIKFMMEEKKELIDRWTC